MDGFEDVYDYYGYYGYDYGGHFKKGFAKKTQLERPRSKSIKISMSKLIRFSAEELLKLTLPFGSVTSIQKTVKKGQAHAVVIYSDAEDAANAMKALNSITSFFEVSEIHTDQTSDYTYDWPPYFPQDDLDVWNSFNNQYLCLRIHNFPRRSYLRKLVYSLLPTSTIDVKVEKKKKSALVMVPDYSAAYWLMDNLSGSLIGSEYIYISFAEEEAGKVFSTKPPRRRRYQQHRGAL
ncbi:uncharacterized protein LOC113159588 isoform X2 [Anabas testudineus]|uniref:uncharacterized protein LOC113159588 isoform X2 n=1 Tax=Anabas testudineus TaxID=64144 RepID=UPI000E46415B|nr:uncharacterized protein LOC113159588 isoform X2 [Anabas testudineus]